jgi:hypothetical protein
MPHVARATKSRRRPQAQAGFDTILAELAALRRDSARLMEQMKWCYRRGERDGPESYKSTQRTSLGTLREYVRSERTFGRGDQPPGGGAADHKLTRGLHCRHDRRSPAVALGGGQLNESGNSSPLATADLLAFFTAPIKRPPSQWLTPTFHHRSFRPTLKKPSGPLLSSRPITERKPRRSSGPWIG